ncbi:MAG: glycoside hydrolase/phage tail family protein [Pseudomonadota bacterium]
MAQLFVTAASAVGAGIAKGGIGAFLARTAAQTAAAYAAGYVDRALFGPQKRSVERPRLDALTVQASQEGAPVLRAFGRARVAGQLIWAANFKETISSETESSGGKGSAPAVETTITEYLYSVSFAVGLCEGPIDRIGRVWADGKPLDLSEYTVRLYTGDEIQLPDSAIEAVQGAGAAPAFRGLAYIVFEDLPLKSFGNRIPQLAFEVEKSLKDQDPDALENRLAAVTMIPASGEFVYGTTNVAREASEGVTRSENTHQARGGTDFSASLDTLTESASALGHVSLIVAWFGDQLDAASCQLRPGVDAAVKNTTPYSWTAGGVNRAGAHLISSVDGSAAYGGTPADNAVIEGILALKAKGLEVMFHPFILMDAPGFPWRGRIDVGANDKTAAASGDIASFFGTATAGDFSIAAGSVVYSGPNEWSFRRMILHYAHLCVLAGGVDAFLLGSELRGLTTVRDNTNAYPAVDALKVLAAEVRSVLGSGTEISYGADWSEYFGHQPGDGSGDVYFHLDDLWSDGNIDFIGIDNYMPLADWRDGYGHADAVAGERGPYDRDYLMGNIQGGEGYDWYYASAADRDAQIRTPITDGAGKPWVFRYKDLWSWWSNNHYNRSGGVELGSPTAWVPESKPFRFTEIGCAAIDKAANQPNVFVDAKSTESQTPYYSTGLRDDMAQRRFNEAHAKFWRDAANNPTSSVYSGTMVDAARQYFYAWDARPYPEFPARSDVWGDAENWTKGHWLNGRLGRAPLSELTGALAATSGFANLESSGLDSIITGYLVDRPLSAREMIDPLADIFQFDIVETSAALRFQTRDGDPVITLKIDDLAERDDGAFQVTLAEESALPSAVRVGFLDEGDDYAAAAVEARDPAAQIRRDIGVELPAAIPSSEAQARAQSVLADAWVMRETLSLSLPPSQLALEPGDIIALEALGADRQYRITDIRDAAARELDLVRVSRGVYDAPAGAPSFTIPPTAPVYGAPAWALFELPLLTDADDPAAPWFTSFADPWPGGVALYRQDGAAAPVLVGSSAARATMGRLATALPSAPSGRWDRRSVDVDLSYGTLSARDALDVLSGANAFAVQSDNGAWEACQFQSAELQPGGVWRLSNLLRGQAGSEPEAFAGASIGARFVLLNAVATQPTFSANLRDLDFTWSAGPDGALPGTENFSSRTLSFASRGLKPLSPVFLRAAWEGADLRLTWIRRTRRGGDSWADEVPLAEAFERYRVRIFDGATVVRTIETDTPSYVYAAADIAADFPGGLSGAITFAVVQLSDAVGEGVSASATAQV